MAYTVQPRTLDARRDGAAKRTDREVIAPGQFNLAWAAGAMAETAGNRVLGTSDGAVARPRRLLGA